MIKASGEMHGQRLMVIGLSGENVTRLMAGEPILFNAAELGLPPMHVVVVGGRTEESIRTELEDHLAVLKFT